MTAPTENELKFFHCEERSSLATNGGCLSTVEIVSGVINNVWPHVLRAERDNGSTLRRKLALKIHQDGNGTLATTEFVIDGPTLGQDRIRLFAATARGTQADITGSERKYVAGGLVNPISAGASTITFGVKHTDDTAGVQVGDDIRLTDKLTPASVTGNVEYLTVATKSVSGLNITITTTSPIGNNYAAYNNGSGGKVGVICPAGVTAAAHDSPVITSAAGTLDLATYPIAWNNMGADEQVLTYLFADATNFTVTSDRHGALAAGSRAGDYSPLHPYWNKSMGGLPAAAWGGTWAPGDTVVMGMHAAASYVWEERNVPAGCAPLSNNRVILVNRSEGV